LSFPARQESQMPSLEVIRRLDEEVEETDPSRGIGDFFWGGEARLMIEVTGILRYVSTYGLEL